MIINTVSLLLNFMWALLLVVALAYGAARLLKRVGFGKQSPSHYIQQLDYLALGPKRGIAIVQVVDKTLCLGVTDARIDLLCELDGEAITARAIDSARALASPPSFADEVLRRVRQWKGNRS